MGNEPPLRPCIPLSWLLPSPPIPTHRQSRGRAGSTAIFAVAVERSPVNWESWEEKVCLVSACRVCSAWISAFFAFVMETRFSWCLMINWFISFILSAISPFNLASMSAKRP